MKDNFLQWLRCPESGEALTLEDARRDPGTGEVIEGRLASPGGARYPIVRGIPRFVESDLYVKNFSLEWTVHKTTQLDSAQRQESQRTFAERIGFTREELAGRLVLDAGTGMGRYSDVATRLGAEVIGMDLSLAVESAADNLRDRANYHVGQADIFRLPFAPGTFDFIFSMGVLHHTPDCRGAFERLVPLLKPGGEIAIWVYAWQGFHSVRSNFWRAFSTHLPPKTLYRLIKRGLPVWERGLRLPLVGKAFKIIPTSGHPDPEWRVLDTFDWYSPRYQSKHRWEEVEEWFRAAGLVDVRRMGFPVAVRGRKPAK